MELTALLPVATSVSLCLSSALILPGGGATPNRGLKEAQGWGCRLWLVPLPPCEVLKRLSSNIAGERQVREGRCVSVCVC